MKKVLKWILKITLLFIIGFAFYKVAGPRLPEVDLSSLLKGEGLLIYKQVNYGWLKTSLPFTLKKDVQQASLAKNTMNAVYLALFRTQVITQLELYSNRQEHTAKKFRLDITYMATIPGIKHQAIDTLTSALTKEGFKQQATQAAKKAQRTKENGAIKYSYQTEAKHKNKTTVLVAISCTKNNTDLILLGYGEDTPQNKKFIEHILAKTECFPGEK